MRDVVLVLDLEHEAARMAVRKLPAGRVCCRMIPADTPAEEILRQEPAGLILSSGFDAPLRALPAWLAELPVPVLALGSASAALLETLGGTVGALLKDRRREEIQYDRCPLLDGLENGERLVNGLFPMVLPEDAAAVATIGEDRFPFAYSIGDRKRFGIQMELEPHDPDSERLLINFACSICGCTPWWDGEAFIGQAAAEIRAAAGEHGALCVMTGGLNSSVAAMLAHRALGERLTCVFVDTGLLQEGEELGFLAFFRDKLGINVRVLRQKERFLKALCGVEDFQEKRRKILELMEEIRLECLREDSGLHVIVRGSGFSETIMADSSGFGAWERVAPLRDLFDDEIRQVADYLGLPAYLVTRQPIPVCGLALSVDGEVTEEKLALLRRCDALFSAAMEEGGYARRLSLYFAVLRPSREGYQVVLRAVSASEGEQSRAARVPYDVLEGVVEEIGAVSPQIRRVLYDLTPAKQYSTGESLY